MASLEQRRFLIEKAADQSVVNSTTLTNDSVLLFPIDALEVWSFTILVPFNVAGVASGFKMTVTGPAAPTSIRWTAFALNGVAVARSEEHTSELQSHSEISYAVFCLKKKK